MTYVRPILDGIVLSKKPSKTASNQDDLVVPNKALPKTFNIVYNLLECVWLCRRALPMPSKVERNDPICIVEWTVRLIV